MKVIASRQIPIVNTRQVVWQPVTDNGDLAMRLAPIDWQPSGAHACIQMLADDLRNAEAKLTKAVDVLRKIGKTYSADGFRLIHSDRQIINMVYIVLAELEGGK